MLSPSDWPMMRQCTILDIGRSHGHFAYIICVRNAKKLHLQRHGHGSDARRLRNLAELGVPSQETAAAMRPGGILGFSNYKIPPCDFVSTESQNAALRATLL